jgi:hypothetical protein
LSSWLSTPLPRQSRRCSPATPDEAHPAAAKRFRAAPEMPKEQLPCALPKWIHGAQILAAVATMARVASPGVDGWTRELLLASFCKPTIPAFEWQWHRV